MKKQTLMNFINIGDGSSRYQTAITERRHEIHLFEQFFEENRNLVTKEWNTSSCDEY
jgi:hypothetical protein